MRLLKIIFLSVLVGFQFCNAQTNSNQKTVHIKDFKWTASIPEDFTPVEQGEWGKTRKKSEDIIGEGILNQEVTLFSYENNGTNKIQAVWQPYDAETCGDYFELNAEANEVMHQMYEAQLPGGNFDSITKTQIISDLEFKRFDVTIDFPEVIKMKVIRFYRLFGDKQFNVYFTVTDEKLEQKMLAVFLKSKFE